MTQELISLPFRLRFIGEDADQHRIEAHAGTKSLHGFSRAIQIITQAYINLESVSRGTALKGASIYLEKSHAGSLIFDFKISISKSKNGVTLNHNTFFDFLTPIVTRAVGRKYNPQTPYVRKLDDDEGSDLLDVTTEAVEDALKEGHRAIGRSVTKISLERPRSSLAYFDAETKRYIEASIPAEEWGDIEGHVTRFNVITGNGRMYVDSLDRIVPFRLDDEFFDAKRRFITWSLHGSNVRGQKKLKFDVKTISSSNGEVKRLLVRDCNPTGLDRN